MKKRTERADHAMTEAMANLDKQIAALLAKKAEIQADFEATGKRSFAIVNDVKHIADSIEAAIDPEGFDARNYR